LDVADSEMLRELRLRALLDEPSAFGSTYERERDFTPDVWPQRLGTPGNAHFVCESADGRPVGMVAVVRDESDANRAYVVGMWVDPVARGRGAADVLLGAAIGWASQEHVVALRLHVTEGNERAERVYLRHGFVRTGDCFARDRDGLVEIEMQRTNDERLRLASVESARRRCRNPDQEDRPMLASVHMADVPVSTSLSLVRKAPKSQSTRGLRSARVALAAPLRSSFFPAPSLKRAGLVAFWDDDEALDAFLADHPVAAALASGWHVRLEPLRAYGSWPGLDATVPRARKIDDRGPAAVLTLGRLRFTQTVRFLRASAKAEAAVLRAPGLIWATGLGRPPFVATCSLWEDSGAIAAYAYDDESAAHPLAIAEDRAKAFHHEEAFIRFRPYASVGHLDGTNPLHEAWLPA
jgi:RimJ/RimL family protein N-acetyltransferase